MTAPLPIELRVGDVAAEGGVNIQTVRYYERRGLVLPLGRTAGGYRVYSPEAVGVVQFIRRAQGLGFRLDEIADLIDLRGDASRPKREVRALAEAKVAEIDERLRDLTAMRQSINLLVAECACDDGAPHGDCVILAALDGVRRDRPGCASASRRDDARPIQSRSSRR